VYWNAVPGIDYQPVHEHLAALGVDCHGYSDTLLWEPGSVVKSDGQPYKVFTPYYRRCIETSPSQPVSIAKPSVVPVGLGDTSALLPTLDWASRITATWQPGERGAAARLAEFLEAIQNYADGRNTPSEPHVSRLSPHLAFGEVSPRVIWYAVAERGIDPTQDAFCRQLVWREFAHYLLRDYPTLYTENLNKRFDAFPWRDHAPLLQAWQHGKTGYPIVDAGMRELWQTGTMHNRVRMIVGSFLVKNLLIHWRRGFEWFWDCLFDANLANNSFGWQWIAGSGADAAPYFRIFNPILQGKKFDADGHYTRRYVPELSAMPNRYLFNPWEAPQSVLGQAGITLGVHYPRPVVSVDHSRREALAAFGSL
jgi:deoxyribodipyrimidine photo-lyase